MINKNESLLVARARNEGIYLLEWISYHYALGFDHIMIVTNDLSDGSDTLLERLSRDGVITWIDVSHEPLNGMTLGQRSYHHASNSPILRKYQWLLVLDIDEFLVIHKHKNVNDYLSKFPIADAILIHWRNFGSSGHVEKPKNKLVIESFTQATQKNKIKLNEFKTFSRIESLDHIGTHFSYFLSRQVTICNACGDTIIKNEKKDLVGEKIYKNPVMDKIDYSTAQINHYSVKSIDEYLFRQDRGDCATSNPGDNPKYNLNYFLNRNIADEHDISALAHQDKTRKLISKCTEKYDLSKIINQINNHYEKTILKIKNTDNRYGILCNFLNKEYNKLNFEYGMEQVMANPEDHFFWEMLLRICKQQKDTQIKLEMLCKIMKLNPQEGRIQLQLGEELIKINENKLAKDILTNCLDDKRKTVSGRASLLISRANL